MEACWTQGCRTRPSETSVARDLPSLPYPKSGKDGEWRGSAIYHTHPPPTPATLQPVSLSGTLTPSILLFSLLDGYLNGIREGEQRPMVTQQYQVRCQVHAWSTGLAEATRTSTQRLSRASVPLFLQEAGTSSPWVLDEGINKGVAGVLPSSGLHPLTEP